MPLTKKQWRIAIIGIEIIVVIFAIGVAFLSGDKYSLEKLTIKHVDSNQIANAMKGDYFYSNYRENSLILTGTVSSVSINNHNVIVEFKTSSSYKAFCDFSSSSPTIDRNQTITILSEGATALREPSAVMLEDCILF
jgi:hypothetical protein